MAIHALGLASASLYYLLTRIADWHEEVRVVLSVLALLCALYFVALRLARSQDSKKLWAAVLFWALVFRVLMVTHPAAKNTLLSADVYRYLWEGSVSAAGESPYLHAPDDPYLGELQKQHHSIWQFVEHKEVPAIYPPGAQMLFAIFPSSVEGFRRVVLVFDIALLALLSLWLKRKRLPLGRILIYAWLPLSVMEFCSSAHLDALFLPFMLGGLYLFETGRSIKEKYAAVFCLSIAVSIKFVAVVPLFFVFWHLLSSSHSRREKFRVFAICVLPVSILYLPFLSSGTALLGGLGAYASRWRFNGSVFNLFENVFGVLPWVNAAFAAKFLGALCSFVVVAQCIQRKVDPLSASVWTFAVVLLVSPTVYPWYLLWFAPLLVLRPMDKANWALLIFCCTSLISYEVLVHPDSWLVPAPLKLFEYGLPLFVLALFKLKISCCEKHGNMPV